MLIFVSEKKSAITFGEGCKVRMFVFVKAIIKMSVLASATIRISVLASATIRMSVLASVTIRMSVLASATIRISVLASATIRISVLACATIRMSVIVNTTIRISAILSTTIRISSCDLYVFLDVQSGGEHLNSPQSEPPSSPRLDIINSMSLKFLFDFEIQVPLGLKHFQSQTL